MPIAGQIPMEFLPEAKQQEWLEKAKRAEKGKNKFLPRLRRERPP